jgi:hypothetical protein
MRVTRWIAAAAVLCLLAAACASDPTPAPGGTAEPRGGSPDILDFEYPLLGGGTIRGADLAGKDVAFWFWAPW